MREDCNMLQSTRMLNEARAFEMGVRGATEHDGTS